MQRTLLQTGWNWPAVELACGTATAVDVDWPIVMIEDLPVALCDRGLDWFDVTGSAEYQGRLRA